MKRIFISLLVVVLANGCVASADTMSTDEGAIKSLIKRMYAIAPDTFEFGHFGRKYNKCDEVVAGKYEPDRQCKLLAEFLTKEAVVKKKNDAGCMTGVHGYFRYPGLDSMDLSSTACPPPPPTPFIGTPIVNRDKAVVHVTFPEDTGDDFYYLRKTSEGWRIYRVETRENNGNDDHIEPGDTVNVFPPENPSK